MVAELVATMAVPPAVSEAIGEMQDQLADFAEALDVAMTRAEEETDETKALINAVRSELKFDVEQLGRAMVMLSNQSGGVSGAPGRT